MIIWLNVPYPQKDEAKHLGACWDSARGSWFVRSDCRNLSPFLKWMDEPERRAFGTVRGMVAEFGSAALKRRVARISKI